MKQRILTLICLILCVAMMSGCVLFRKKDLSDYYEAGHIWSFEYKYQSSDPKIDYELRFDVELLAVTKTHVSLRFFNINGTIEGMNEIDLSDYKWLVIWVGSSKYDYYSHAIIDGTIECVRSPMPTYLDRLTGLNKCDVLEVPIYDYFDGEMVLDLYYYNKRFNRGLANVVVDKGDKETMVLAIDVY